MSTANITITADSLPIGFCGLTQAQWAVLAGLLHGSLEGNFRNFNSGSSEPAPGSRTDPWFRANADGTPDKLYWYVNGVWISRHPIPVGFIGVYLVSGNPTDIATFDGGEDTGAVTATSGPMWERATEFNGRVPMGIGPLPSGASVVTNVSGGNETKILSISELPAHSHSYTKTMAGGDANNGGANGVVFQETQTGSVGLGQAFSLLPPFLGVVMLRRTARLFYRL